MPLIRLRPSHTKYYLVLHPLLANVMSYSSEELDELARQVAEDPEKGTELILAFRACLKSLVGRYMYYWREARRFEDDLVGEGFVALSSLMPEITLDMLENRTILKIGSRRIQDKIHEFLNRNQALSSPGMWIQKALASEGHSPIYKGASDIELIPDWSHPTEDGDEWKRDVLETLRKMQPRDEIDAALLDRWNWGRGHQELADELGVGVGTIHRRKARLYKQYQELTR